MGTADKVPAGSRWAHLTSAFRQTIVRKLVCPGGMASFCGHANAGPQVDLMDNDTAAAMQDFLQCLNGVRARRGREYLRNPRTCFEVGVLAIVLNVADKLLFAMLGGADRKDNPCTMLELLGHDQSLISKVLADMLSLLENWLGDPLREPWMLVELLGAPMQSSEFVLWARSQILLMDSALARRSEANFCALPFCLIALIDPGLPAERVDQVVARCLAYEECCLDTFTAAFRLRFPTRGKMLSPRARGALRALFNHYRIATDWSERQNAEVTASKPSRSSARDFAHFSRHRVLRQAVVVHRNEGGLCVKQLPSLMESVAPTQAELMPLLLPAGVTSANSQELVPSQNPLAPAPRCTPAQPRVEGDPLSTAAIVPADVLLSRADDAFMFRKHAVQLEGVLPEKSALVTSREGHTNTKRRRGLNPMMAHRNQFLASAKATRGNGLDFFG